MAFKPFISEAVRQSIAFNIDQLFSRLKIRLLGPFYRNDNLLNTFTHDKTLSLPGIYLSAYADAAPNYKPTFNALQSLAAVTESYIDAAAERTKAKAFGTVQNVLTNAARQDDFDYEQSLHSALHNVFDQAHGEVKRVVETELQRTKTIGLQEGILDVMASQGIDDPTVAFAVKKDKFLCKYCREFFLQDDGVTPRVYKLSELGTGYLDKKNPTPVLPPVHPNCFLYGQGRVLTNHGFKRIKNVSFGDTVLTHRNRYRGVENTLNFLKNPYTQNFYQIKLHSTDSQSICITPDHQVWTTTGMKPIFEVDTLHDRFVKVVKKCVSCSKRMNFSHPQYFCSDGCRDNVYNNISKYIDKIAEEKVELVEFSARDLVVHHERTEPTFLYDITVKEDHSLTYNGLVTKNCRCIYDGNAKVITEQGLKKLKNVKIGDFVLTHNGRFKKVLATFGQEGKQADKDDYIYIVRYLENNNEEKILRTTGDHLLMTQRGWVRVDELSLEDKLMFLHKTCEHCKELFPYFSGNPNARYCSAVCKDFVAAKRNKDIGDKLFNERVVQKGPWECINCFKIFEYSLAYRGTNGKAVYRSKPEFCSILCSSQYNANSQWKSEQHRLNISEKNSISMYKQYKEGTRTTESIVEARKILFKDGKKASKPQIELFNIIKEQYDDAQLDAPIGTYFGDIVIPSAHVVIEYDGFGHWLDVLRKQKTLEEKQAFDVKRENFIRQQGYHVLRYSDEKTYVNVFDDIRRVAQNSLHEYNFKGIDIVSVTKLKVRLGDRKDFEKIKLYDIQVEDDSSFIVNGLVSHNCLIFGVYNGFSFNKSGVLEYKYDGYDEYEAQRGIKKNLSDMVKHDCNEHRDSLSIKNSK